MMHVLIRKRVTIDCMIENIQKNKKPLIIGLLVLAIIVFLSMSGGNSNDQNTASVVPIDETEEVATTTSEVTEIVATSTASTTPETSSTNENTPEQYTGTGGGDQDILLQTENSDVTTPETTKNPIVTAGENILAGIGSLSEEELEQLKPDLEALIAALEALIEDLENYIDYLGSQQNT